MLPPEARRRHFRRQLFAARVAEDLGAPRLNGSEAEERDRSDLAWRTGETDVFIASAERLSQGGVLRGNEPKRLADKLCEAGRFADALAVHRGHARPEHSQYWRSLAVALAGAGQLAEAGEALERADQLGGEMSKPQAAFAEALRLACAEGTIPAWPQATSLLEAFVRLGLPRRAAEVLATALGASPPESEEETLEALRLAQDLIRMLDPAAAAAADLMKSIRRWRRQIQNRPSTNQPATVRSAVLLCQALALAGAGRDVEAIPLLAPLSNHLKGAEIKGAEDARLELARTVGRLALREVEPCLAAGGRRKIVDMFPMNDELLMLKIKLEEMHSWVDHFVIVEAAFTFRGQPKPLHFDRNKAEFARFADKIVHVVVDAPPPWASTPWVREFYQRDRGLQAIARLCGPDDLVLVTDVDEIVRREAVEAFEGPFAGLGMPCYGHFFNLERIQARQMRWASALKVRYLMRVGASYAKIGLPRYLKPHSMDDAGWHFSGVRDVDGLLSKYTSYSNDQWANLQRDEVAEAVAQIRAAGGAPGCVRREIDDSFPAYIRENREALSSLIL